MPLLRHDLRQRRALQILLQKRDIILFRLRTVLCRLAVGIITQERDLLVIRLGVDPGYATTGFGLIRAERGTYALLRYGTVTTPAGLPFPQRLNILFEDMTQLLEVTKPEAVAVEELFWGHNITTGIGVSHGRGVILLAIERAGVPLFEYTPMQVKQAVVGYGKAEKHQVMDMTRRLLRLDRMPRPDDAADAIAIALCHARSSTSQLARLMGGKP